MNAVIDHDIELRFRALRKPEDEATEMRLALENIKIMADLYTDSGIYSLEALLAISKIAKEALR